MLIIIFIVNVNDIHNLYTCAPQEHEDKIVSTYKRKVKQPWIGCVVGQRLQCIMTSEMVTSILLGD